MTDGSGAAGIASHRSPETRFVRARDVLWRQLGGVVLLRTVADPEIVELSGAAVLLWMALTEPATAAELATELAAVAGAPEDVVAPDVRGALADLVHRGIATQLPEA